MGDADHKREQEEYGLLRENGMGDLALVAAQLREHAIVAAGVGHAGELLDGQDSGAGDNQYEADVDGEVADGAIHRVRRGVHRGAGRTYPPVPDDAALRVNRAIADVIRVDLGHDLVALLGADTGLVVVDEQIRGLDLEVRVIDDVIRHDDGAGV